MRAKCQIIGDSMSDCPTDEPLKPLTIRMRDSDNVAIVANDGGLPAGTALPSGILRDGER